LDEALQQVREALDRAGHVTVLTGEEVGPEAVGPTFHQDGDSVWERFRAEELATPELFRNDPALVWRWYVWRRSIISTAPRDPVFDALAAAASRMEARGAQMTMLTENVDGCCERAGFHDAIELLGSMWRTRCVGCGRLREDRRVALEGPELPSCDHCGGMLRPDVVWFGEALDTERRHASLHAVRHSNALVLVGAAASSHTASSLVGHARQAGVLVADIHQVAASDTPGRIQLVGDPAAIVRQIFG
jgi:NAD-dependent deacetylase